MWSYRKILKIKWVEKFRNKTVLRRLKETKAIIKVIRNRRGRMLGHILRHGRLIGLIIQGAAEDRVKIRQAWI